MTVQAIWGDTGADEKGYGRYERGHRRYERGHGVVGVVHRRRIRSKGHRMQHRRALEGLAAPPLTGHARMAANHGKSCG